ncbi:DUF5681 domain-containing protein [Acidobacteria bacterium AH-259-O06]|nr:DUF5681 domain-containing protein [Acidobacteria bacterium AH-259-O06]
MVMKKMNKSATKATKKVKTKLPEKQGVIREKIGNKRPPKQSRWKPGLSGNPKGRPKKSECLTSILKEEIAKIDPEDRKKRTWVELVAIATIKLAIKGNATALKEVWERMDGKVKQDLGLEPTAPIQVLNYEVSKLRQLSDDELEQAESISRKLASACSD